MELYDDYAEQALLGALFLNNDYIKCVMDILEKKHFFVHDNAMIYSSMLKLYNERGCFDVITIGDKFANMGLNQGLYAYMGETSDSVRHISSDGSDVLKVRAFCDIILEKYRLRMFGELSETIRNKIVNTSDITSAKIEEFLIEASKVISNDAKRRNEKSMKISDIAQQVWIDLEKASENEDPITGLKTGFSELDMLTHGYQPGQLIIVGARPAMGKTAFALNNVLGCENNSGAKTVIFSLEMTAPELAKRLFAAKGKIPHDCFMSGNLSTEQWDKLAKVAENLKDNIFIDDTPGISINHIRSVLTEISEESKIDMVVFDYLQLGNSDKKSSFSRENDVSEISRGLKSIAKEFNVPVVCLSQLNRKLEDRRGDMAKIPVMSDLRESGAIEQDADIILFLYRDEVYNAETEEPGVCRVICAKNRSGRTSKTIKLKWHGEYNLFTNLKRNYE